MSGFGLVWVRQLGSDIMSDPPYSVCVQYDLAGLRHPIVVTVARNCI